MRIEIKPQLQKIGITKYELAKRIDVTYPTISALYKGTGSSIRLDTLEKLCKIFECTPNDILVFDDLQY